MNLTIIKNTALALVCAATLFPLSSCVKDNFTVPGPKGANVNPVGVEATMTIKQFKQQYYVPVLGKILPTLIPDSIVLTGIVNADDRSGNFYKTICLQDSTGGLQIKIAGTGLYYDYPVGRRIWIKTKGLYIFDYGGTLILGGYIDLAGTHPTVGGIALGNAPNSIIKGEWGLPVPVQKVTISQLNNVGGYVDMQSMLYEVDDVEYGQQNVVSGATYADALNKASANIVLEDCNGFNMVVRSSGYANFATAQPPATHGNILGIYTYFSFASSGNFQLTIRDTTDVMFTSSHRCH